MAAVVPEVIKLQEKKRKVGTMWVWGMRLARLRWRMGRRYRDLRIRLEEVKKNKIR